MAIVQCIFSACRYQHTAAQRFARGVFFSLNPRPNPLSHHHDRGYPGETSFDRIEDGIAYAQTEYDAPKVDNNVIIEIGDEAVKEGDFRQVIVEDSTAYELFGRIEEG